MTERQLENWFKQIYTETYPTIERVGRHMIERACIGLSMELEDIIHETYLTLYKKRHTLCNHENITGWLIVAFKFNALRRMRKWARQHDAMERASSVETSVRSGDLAASMEDEEAVEIMRAAIGARNFGILLDYQAGRLSVDQIAQMLDKSVGATYTFLSRLRKRCLLVLQKNGFHTLLLLWIALHFGRF